MSDIIIKLNKIVISISECYHGGKNKNVGE